jgi:hypothetical protein
MNPLLETIALELFGIVAWIVLFPVVIVLVTPVILVSAAFQRESYASTLGRMYASVAAFWKRQSCSFLP